MADVATTKLLENDRVAVWGTVLEPGQQTGLHTHRYSHLRYVIEGSSVETFDGDGHSLGIVEAEAGDAVYFQLVAHELFVDGARFPATHNAKNIGDRRYREILVELK